MLAIRWKVIDFGWDFDWFHKPYVLPYRLLPLGDQHYPYTHTLQSGCCMVGISRIWAPPGKWIKSYRICRPAAPCVVWSYHCSIWCDMVSISRINFKDEDKSLDIHSWISMIGKVLDYQSCETLIIEMRVKRGTRSHESVISIPLSLANNHVVPLHGPNLFV